MKSERKALLLSIGYGQGHHSAANALAAELTRRGWQASVADVCEEAQPAAFRITQSFYRFCVEYAPWIWGMMYEQLDTADWSQMIRLPYLAASMRHLRRKIQQEQPDLVVCTYPLFAYMLDALAREGTLHAPYAVVITDSLAISRPWMQHNAPLICLPDEYSLELVMERYAPAAERLVATGFPVRAEFAATERSLTPGSRGEGVHIIYSFHASLPRVVADVQAILSEWPCVELTLLAGKRADRLRAHLGALPAQVHIHSQPQDMAKLMQTAHIYIGKAGAATMFEAYSAGVPMLVNCALPGQEMGNLRLLQRDNAGRFADSPERLLQTLRSMLADSAAGWRSMRRAMVRADRACGAARTANELERRFFT